MADCHRRVSNATCKSCSGSTTRDGATVQPPLPSPELNQEKEREVHGGLSCEIDRTYARFRSLTTGTFNLVVKDRIAIRQSGANSVQANPHKCESDCPRNPTNILCCAKSCQPKHPTGFPDVFHIGKFRVGVRHRRARPAANCAVPDGTLIALRRDPALTCWANECRRFATGAPEASNTRNSMAFRSDENSNTRLISAHADAED